MTNQTHTHFLCPDCQCALQTVFIQHDELKRVIAKVQRCPVCEMYELDIRYNPETTEIIHTQGVKIPF